MKNNEEYIELYKEVQKRGCSITPIGVLFGGYSHALISASTGIKIMYEKYGDDVLLFAIRAIKRYMNGDYGAEENAETDFPLENPDGCYPSPLGEFSNEGAIMVHGEMDYVYGMKITLYLACEYSI